MDELEEQIERLKRKHRALEQQITHLGVGFAPAYLLVEKDSIENEIERLEQLKQSRILNPGQQRRQQFMLLGIISFIIALSVGTLVYFWEILFPTNMIFASSQAPNLLQEPFTWFSGEGDLNAVLVHPSRQTITITASDGADQWAHANSAPMVTLPVSGDFEAIVEVNARPDANHQFAAMGIRSSSEGNWMRIALGYTANIPLVVTQFKRGDDASFLEDRHYRAPRVYLKLRRVAGVITAFYSEDREVWNALNLDNTLIDDHAELFLWSPRSRMAENSLPILVTLP